MGIMIPSMCSLIPIVHQSRILTHSFSASLSIFNPWLGLWQPTQLMLPLWETEPGEVSMWSGLEWGLPTGLPGGKTGPEGTGFTWQGAVKDSINGVFEFNSKQWPSEQVASKRVTR